jgi:hypothetical protein
MMKALLDLLKVINPADQISYGAMRYEDLVLYSRDWLQTEAEEITAKTAEPASLSLT